MQRRRALALLARGSPLTLGGERGWLDAGADARRVELNR
jgi:hypothetical protein